jgi:hypothetical protein
MGDHLTQTTDETISYGNNEVSNFDFSQGTGNVFTSWLSTLNSGAIVEDTVNFTSSPRSSQMHTGAILSQQFVLPTNSTYRLKYSALGSDTGSAVSLPKVSVFQIDGGGTPFVESHTISPTIWTQYSSNIKVGSGTCVIMLEQASIATTSPMNYDDISLELVTTTVTVDHLLQEPEMPRRFHMALVNKTIADFYKDPRNEDKERAMFYENQYEVSVKEGKKHSKSNHIGTGYIKPVEF